MQFVHWREYLDAGDIVVVNCSHRCNVRLMSDGDFESYRRGGTHRYHGGHYERLPARIAAPRAAIGTLRWISAEAARPSGTA